MYALVQRVIGSTKVTVARPAVSSSKARKVVSKVKLNNITKRFVSENVKIEGHAALLKKLEDPAFRKDFIANKPVPPGRSIWNDNPRLHIRLPADPLPYVWPEGKDFSSYDEVLKKTWEDELFELKWFGKSRGQVQGGDWAANRVSMDVPPRVKIYYAQIVDQFQMGNLLAATKAFNALITDFLAPVGSIPYGVYHTMLLIYKKREKFDRALQMFQEIVSHHTPTPDDYALGMEVLLSMNQPREALEVWDALRLRPSLKPNSFTYSALMRAHALLGDMDRVTEVFAFAESEIPKYKSKVEYAPIFNTLLEIYADLGYRSELKKLTDSITNKSHASTHATALAALNKVGLFEKTITSFKRWVSLDDPNGSISIYNSQLKALSEMGQTEEVADLLTKMESNGITLDMSSYAILIANRNKFTDNARLLRLADDGLALNNIRPSIRNYRASRTANLLNNASNLALVKEIMDDLVSKEIDFDEDYFEAVAFVHLQHKQLQDAIEAWRLNVLEQKLLPSRLSFSHFFSLAGTEGDRVQAAAVWKISQELAVKPDRQFAAALALALQPNRNFFGLQATRQAHSHWAAEPTNTRVLDRKEIKDFTKFIDHVISTFGEEEQSQLTTVYEEMHDLLHTPVEEENVIEQHVATPRDPTPQFRASSFGEGRQSVLDEAHENLENEEPDTVPGSQAAAAKTVNQATEAVDSALPEVAEQSAEATESATKAV